MGWSGGSEVKAEWTGVRPRGGQRYVLARAAVRVLFNLCSYFLTYLAGRGSTVAATAPGLRPRDVDTRRKKVRARARIFLI